MQKYKADGFRPIQAESGYDAAKIFGDRLARRYGRNHRSIVRDDSWTSTSLLAQATVVAPSGVVECQEWIRVEVVQ